MLEPKVNRFSRTLSNVDTYFTLKLLTLVFSQLETLTATLEKIALRFHHAENMVKAIRESLSELRNSGFPNFGMKHKQRRVN